VWDKRLRRRSSIKAMYPICSRFAICSFVNLGAVRLTPGSYFEFVSVRIRRRAHIRGMIANALKLAALAGLLLISGGAWPNPRYGAAIAIGLCIVAAVILHFAAP